MNFFRFKASVFPFVFMESAGLVSTEQRFFLSPGVGVFLRESGRACDLRLLVRDPRSA